MRYILFFFSWFFFLQCFAQKKFNLNGTWKSEKGIITTCNDTSFLEYDAESYYWLSEKEPYLLTIDNKTTIKCCVEFEGRVNENINNYKMSNLKVRKHKLVFNQFSNVDTNASYFYFIYQKTYGQPKLKVNYSVINDSLIVFKHLINNQKCYAEYKLHKVTTIHYPSISELKARKNKLEQIENKRLFKIDSVKNHTLKIVDVTKPLKPIYLKPGGEFIIKTRSSNFLTLQKEYAEYYVEALDLNTEDSIISFYATKEKIKAYNTNDGYNLNKEKYNVSYALDSKFNTVKIADVESIWYTSTMEYKANNISNFLGWLSFSSALIVAPLVSINYRHLDFNKQRYFKVAGTSLGFTAIALTINICTHGKSYDTKNVKDRKNPYNLPSIAPNTLFEIIN